MINFSNFLLQKVVALVSSSKLKLFWEFESTHIYYMNEKSRFSLLPENLTQFRTILKKAMPEKYCFQDLQNGAVMIQLVLVRTEHFFALCFKIP